MATIEPPSDPGRHLLDDLREVEGAWSGRLRLELLDHLVVVALDEGRALPQHLVFTASRFGTPGSARLLERAAAALDPSTSVREADTWVAQAATAGEVARASALVAVAPYLTDREHAYVTAMGLSSQALWVASLLALGRNVEARGAARGELLSRVRAVTVDVTVPTESPDPWWQAIRLAGSVGSRNEVGDRTAAVAALVAVPDGAWHLLALRARPQLRTVIDDAVRSGQAYLVSLRQASPAWPVERHARFLGMLDGDARAALAEELTRVLMKVAGVGAPPPGDTNRSADQPPAQGGPHTAAPPPGPPGRPRGPPRPEPLPGPPPRRRRGIPGLIRPKAAKRRSRRQFESRSAGEYPLAAESAAATEPPRPAVVSTGFSDVHDPGAALDPHRALRRSDSYVFWLQVAPEPVVGSIEDEHVWLPPDLPERARLTVALFAFDGELGLAPGATTGVLELVGDGTAVVVEQPGHGVTLDGERRLRFPVTTPDVLGPARLRCSIYHRGVLVQSRIVTARVDESGSPPMTPTAGARAAPALRSVTDYRLFRVLEPRTLEALSEHRASLLLNDDGAGTHGLRFASVDGDEVITRDVSIAEGAIADQIRMARSALRRVSWGNEEEWASGNTYRYGGDLDEARLTTDLVALAANGARFFQLLVEEVAGSTPDADADPDPYIVRDRISEVLRRPGRVQIALQRSPGHILPAALVYDHWLTDSAAVEDYRLCPEFAGALRSHAPLEESSCLQGDCPQARHGADLTVVCPSGFWGFRHELGFPVTAGPSTDATEVIAVDDVPAVSVAVSMELTSHAAHVRALQGMVGDDGRAWRFADTRDGFLAGLRSDDRQVVYLYCHGGVTNNVPYVRLGEHGARPITRLDMANERVRWQTTRPLVILNGCHTTALDPETAIDFVRFFVRTALASGVIGTEITVFEELGQVFGQAFLQRFLQAGTTVGSAVRGARLDLLASGNPLGLVYIPFALAGLRLAAGSGAGAQGGGA